MKELFTLVFGVLFFVSLVIIYFAPAIIAQSRRHRHVNAIAMLNLLLGWTFLGWVAAIVWAFMDQTHKPIPSGQSRNRYSVERQPEYDGQ